MEESQQLSGLVPIHEVDIERYEAIAKVYGVVVVPTLVSGPSVLSGVPSDSDLHSFVLKAASRSVVSSDADTIPIISSLSDNTKERLLEKTA